MVVWCVCVVWLSGRFCGVGVWRSFVEVCNAAVWQSCVVVKFYDFVW